MPRCMFHDIGHTGEPWPTIIRVLTHASGVYIIRDKHSKKILYVGSSKKALYGTITRHMQEWGRRKKFWRGAYGKAHDPGVTYNRSQVEVCVEVMKHGEDHLAREAELIHKLKPRDNLVTNPDGEGEARELEEAPF